MFAVSDIAPNGANNNQSQTQQQVIASVVALQRVIAGQASADSGDASSRGFSGEKPNQQMMTKRQEPKSDVSVKATSAAKREETSAEARSIIEAQEASETDQTITKAFQARHGLADLLTVIRDPEDRMLPNSPE